LDSMCVASSDCFNLYTLPLILGVTLGLGLFLALFACLYLRAELNGRLGLFKQEVLAEDKLIREEFPLPKTREEMLREEIAGEIRRQLLDDQLRRAREDREVREREEERRRKEEEEKQSGKFEERRQEAQRELDALFTTEKKEDEEPDLDSLIQGGATETKGKKRDGGTPKAEVNKFE